MQNTQSLKINAFNKKLSDSKPITLRASFMGMRAWQKQHAMWWMCAKATVYTVPHTFQQAQTNA